MKADKKVVERLLKTAKGQIDGLLRMVEEDRYCIDISQQLLATASILRKANQEVLKAHIDQCLKEAFAAGDASAEEKKVREILEIMDNLAKS